MPTIAAIATAPGRGGISIIRISGPGSKSLLARVFLPHSRKFENFKPWTMHHGVLLNSEDSPLDDVLAVFMPAPKTYTGEDMAEVHCHGGSLMAQEALESLLRLGARLAEPGEFTRRGFLNGRMDLSQAEAVAELIAAPSAEALSNGLARLEGALGRQVEELREKLDNIRALAKIGVDFPEDEVEGLAPVEFVAGIETVLNAVTGILAGAGRARLMEKGCSIVLAGNVNVGKSSLLNALCGRERALVTDIPGTTRDFIEEHLDLRGLPARLIDTAGLREQTSDEVENLGMERSRKLLKDADLAVFVLDVANPCLEQPEDVSVCQRRLLLWNKTDICEPPPAPAWAAGWHAVAVSAKTGANLDVLVDAMRGQLLADACQVEIAAAPNQRQAHALERAKVELELLLNDVQAGAPYDCCLARLDMAAQYLGEIVALAPDDELLDRIFSQFCIGK